jgi:putative membrane-bound dehydrogenase-like protein
MQCFSRLLPFLLMTASVVAAPLPLFDGKTLDGWEGDAKLWRVEDGMITGGSLTEKVPHNDFLATVKSYSNFDLRVMVKLSGTEGFINSGVQIRSLRMPGSPEMSGYQVDYGKGWYGKLYDESRRNKVVGESKDVAAVTAAIKEGDWNEYRIRADGARIQSWINGVPALDYTEADPNIAQDGHIGIQVHGGGKALVQVKEVTIEELPPTPDAPTWEKLGKPGAKKPAAAATPAAGKRDLSYNAVATTAKTPEEERACFKVPDGFEVELVAAESEGIGKFVPIAFDQKGALWTTTAFEYPVDGNENPAAADALYESKAKDKVLVYDRDPSQPTGYSPKPRVFADGLAIPLGVLPFKNGCYVQHGHDIAFLEDTDNDGKADKRTVILTGFGVQDSHLFPHQFLRAPGGWIWMAQGAFNYGKVRRPDEPAEKAVQFDQTRMAKFRPDGSGFDITSNGPCNIWGLVLNGEGEAFIQEANDFGYPVMPFHEYANYPGCSDRQWKSYAPEFPSTATFKVGGTGLSGLALLDAGWAALLDKGSAQSSVLSAQSEGASVAKLSTENSALSTSSQTMLVANPITNRINAIKMHRDGPRWRLEKLPDFVESSDPWFRPVAITVGPDGCLYIVDWYNKIISHNEVPRNHPDRDKTRGRIWRVKATAAKPFDVPDFTKLSGDELIAKLGGESLAQSHLAWQAIVDREDRIAWKLPALVADKTKSAATRIAGLWILRTIDETEGVLDLLLHDENRNVRREAVQAWVDEKCPRRFTLFRVLTALLSSISDPDPEVRAEVIRRAGARLDLIAKLEQPFREKGDSLMFDPIEDSDAIDLLMKFAREPLADPTAPSTHKPQKTIKVREAYDREFERYLVRMFLERHPDAVAKFLDSDAAKPLSVEARLLASLALEPKASAARVAKLLPQLQRAPGQEEVLRLAQFPDEPGVGQALQTTLANPATRAATLEALLAVRTKLDTGKLTPFLADAASALLASNDAASLDLGVKLAAGFKLASAEPALVALLSRVGWASRPPSDASRVAAFRVGTEATTTSQVRSGGTPEPAGGTPTLPGIIRALAEIGSSQTELFANIATTALDAALRDEALAALAASKAADAPQRVLGLYPKLAPAQRRLALDKLAATKPGAAAVVAALTAGTLAKSDLDAATLDRLQAVLGPDDPVLMKLVDSLGALFRPVLAFDGTDNAWSQTNVTLDGPCTIEAWMRLDPQGRKIGNADGLAGAPGQLDINFFGERARIYAFPPLADVVVAKKPIMPGLWTHVAATRDAAGIWKLYLDGELDATGTKPAPGKIENVRLAWTSTKGGTQGALSELRLWNRERTADEIRAASDRSLPANTPSLVFTSAAGDWGKLQAGAKVIKTSDFPPILTQDEAATLDAKYATNRALAEKRGDPARGKVVAAVCQACHLMGPTGGNIGPNLSGVGAMGTEAILRNILQPNAAMENGYRIYRVELKTGDLVDALFVSEDKDAVVVRMPGADDRRIPRAEIRDAKYLRRSLMPEGLLDTMTPEQVSDLFAFLKTMQ